MKSMLKNIRQKFAKGKDGELEPAGAVGKVGGAGYVSSSSNTKTSSGGSTSSKATSNLAASGGLNTSARSRKNSVMKASRRSSAMSHPDSGDGTKYTKKDLVKVQTSFSDAAAGARPALFIQKLQLCQIMFDWSEEAGTKDNRVKEVKRQMLLELVDYIGRNKNIYTDQALDELIKMVSTNLFRSLPPRMRDDGDDEDEEPAFEPSWPHLQIVYEFFLRFIVSSDMEVKTLKKYISGPFVLRLLDLFDSEDPRERDYLKTILHRVYAKFMSLRALIRRSINNVFFTFIYDTGRHNGVAELLEILGSIINGFALPLKAEHKTFLIKVLTPMHKLKHLAVYHQQLSYCVTQFVDKDPKLAVPVIQGLLRYWPMTSNAKELLFLNELEELLELTQPAELQVLTPDLFKVISKSIGSPHFQVAERALFLWHNRYISSMIADHKDQILPLIFDSLHVNSQFHWNPTVNNLTLDVLKIFMEIDPPLVDQLTKKYNDENKKKVAARKAKDDQWKKLVAADKAKVVR